MERIAMSQEERDWLEWLKRARDGVVTQRRAAEKMGVTDRWVRTLLNRMKEKGDEVVVHALRGQPCYIARYLLPAGAGGKNHFRNQAKRPGKSRRLAKHDVGHSHRAGPGYTRPERDELKVKRPIPPSIFQGTAALLLIDCPCGCACSN